MLKLHFEWQVVGLIAFVNLVDQPSDTSDTETDHQTISKRFQARHQET